VREQAVGRRKIPRGEAKMATACADRIRGRHRTCPNTRSGMRRLGGQGRDADGDDPGGQRDARPAPEYPPGDQGAAGMPDITPGAGPPGQALVIGGASEELAAFLGMSLEQLQSELSAEGATPASVAEAHSRTREELKTFFMEQAQAQTSDAVAAGATSHEDADRMPEALASRIDDIIDGKMPSGGSGPLPIEPTLEGR
jgi:hypothetical protein